jgi:murein DD-endopeptidase MepM/ murein hydrolase activator NlpD
MSLSGTFGELRANHLHSGIDIRTNHEEGYPVYAVADGFVSRIKVQGGGFGYALYIDHPNGYTSVYGHLQRYNNKIDAWIKAKQYELQEFEVDIFPKKGEIPVSKGDIIAFTGSSGLSGGPHLHYEIRNTLTEYPINPLFFGYKMADTIPPDIKTLRIIPIKNRGLINGSSDALDVPLQHVKNRFFLASLSPIEVSGDIAFGIEASDLQNGNETSIGVYSVDFYLDSLRYNAMRFESFSFSQSRAINSIIDYEAFMKSNRKIIRSVVDPNNPLKIYDEVRNGGVFSFNDNNIHLFRCVVKDFHGRHSELYVWLKSKKVPYVWAKAIDYQQIFYWNRVNYFDAKDLKMVIPKGALYDTLFFKYSVDPGNDSLYSAIHCLHDIYTPLHENFSLSIKTNPVNTSLQKKLVMVRLDENGKWISEGGRWANGFMTAKVRSFGKFAVAADTIRPVIRLLSGLKKKALREKGIIQFKIGDNLSGVKSFNGFINGRWVLFSLDAKSSIITYEIDSHIRDGVNLITIELEDQVGNKTTFRTNFNY